MSAFGINSLKSGLIMGAQMITLKSLFQALIPDRTMNGMKTKRLIVRIKVFTIIPKIMKRAIQMTYQIIEVVETRPLAIVMETLSVLEM